MADGRAGTLLTERVSVRPSRDHPLLPRHSAPVSITALPQWIPLATASTMVNEDT